MPRGRVILEDEVLGHTNQADLRFARENRFNFFRRQLLALLLARLMTLFLERKTEAKA